MQGKMCSVIFEGKLSKMQFAARFFGFILWVVVLSSNGAKAQEQENPYFERDSISFYEYTIGQMDQLPKEHKALVKAFEKSFESFWYSGDISDAQRDTIYGFSVQMMKRRFLTYPTFYQYLEILPVLTRNATLFADWHRSAQDVFQEEKNNLAANYISSSYQFIIKGVLFEEGSINWAVEKDTFQFVTGKNPFFRVDDVNLIGYSQTDTSRLLNTSGRFFLNDRFWEGSGGVVTWQRAGFDSIQMNAQIRNYVVDLTKSYYDADSVTFSDTRIFDQPISGKLRDGYVYVFDSTDVWYPRFVSKKFFELDKLIDNVILKGYLSYRGDRIMIAGKLPRKAAASLVRDDKEILSIFGDLFFIKKNRFFSQSTSVSIYIGENDSIYHPDINFEYNPQKDRLTLTPRSNQNKYIPYSNSLHKMDMFCRDIQWNIKDSILTISDMRGLDKRANAVFESYDYFSKSRFYAIQMFDDRNPLILLNKFMVDNNQKLFHLSHFIDFTEFSEHETDLLMMRLAAEGFVIYDRVNKLVTVKPKLTNYVQAWYGLRDYDVIRFTSQVEGTTNAEINLKTYDLDIKGIPVVHLSDSQRVFIYPTDNRIVMKKNRDFTFSGRLIAGNLELFGQEGYFNYDDFSIALPTVDSLRINLRTNQYAASGELMYRRVNTVLENLDGALQIDRPDNKSGLKVAPEYPILRSEKEASAYYDKYSRFVGVYDRNRFEYHVDPFTIDSLDNFDPETIEFSGFLESSIFPVINEPLKIQPDFSLGFTSETPEEGYPAYQGKGQYFDLLNLSNMGLRGKGVIDYLASEVEAMNVIFFPDSASGNISSFALAGMTGETEYPTVNVDTAKMRWLQVKDSMIVYEPAAPFAMYQDQVNLNGSLALTPEALRGKGVAYYDLAAVNSKEFTFENAAFSAVGSNIDIATLDNKSTAVSLVNYNVDVDVDRKKGNFLSDQTNSTITFPYNQFMSYLNDISWDVSDKILDMRISDINDLSYLDSLNYREIVDEELSGAKFISTNKEQDSLQFFALKGKYDMRQSIIEAEKVKYINVADAAIFPFEERLRIGQGAAIEVLKQAKILTSIENKAHFFDDATVELVSRHEFNGAGTYRFKDGIGEAFEVDFKKLTVEDNQTVGETRIEQTDPFQLSPYFDYYGDLQLNGGDSLLTFDGYFRINDENCNLDPAYWVKFTDDVYTPDIHIAVQHPIGDTSKTAPLYASIHYSPSLREIYPLFYRPERIGSDYPLWQLDGEVTYDSHIGVYRIINNISSLLPDTLKPYYEYNQTDCSYNGLASLDFGVLFGRMDVTPHGVFEMDKRGDFNMQGILGVDFLFAKNALKLMSDSLLKYDLNRVDPDEKWFEKSAAQILPASELQAALKEVNLYGMLRTVPEPMNQTLFFHDVKFEWNDRVHSFIAAGKLGLGNIGSNVIGRYVNGIIEIQPTPDGGNLNIYIEPEEGLWYYFTYSGTLLEAASSDITFNEKILEVKKSKRYISAKKGKKKYLYDVSGVNLKEFFLQRMEAADINF